MEIPVYMFTGFLDAGKSTFLQSTLEDKRFNNGERTLVLLCEEGECELDATRFSGKNVTVQRVDNIDELINTNLLSWQKNCRAQRVMIEYNGMWMMNTLYENLPENWAIYQEMMFADANTFLSYNANMRQLMVVANRDIVISHRESNRLMKVISTYGMRKDPLTGIYKKHNGVDLRARNAMVYSMFPGIVHKVGYDERSGNYVIIQHGEIAVSFCHLSKILIIKGSRVHAHEVIGISGNTGRSTGEHLHVTCKMKGTYINPEIIFQYIRNILDSPENDKN